MKLFWTKDGIICYFFQNNCSRSKIFQKYQRWPFSWQLGWSDKSEFSNFHLKLNLDTNPNFISEHKSTASSKMKIEDNFWCFNLMFSQEQKNFHRPSDIQPTIIDRNRDVTNKLWRRGTISSTKGATQRSAPGWDITTYRQGQNKTRCTKSGRAAIET